MEKLKMILGYTLAALAVPAVIAMFAGMDFFAAGLVNGTGLHVSPWLTGGEVVQTAEHGTYQTKLHEMVRQGLIGEREEGFVQVDWTPAKGLPPRIEEAIDADGDGKDDFTVRLNTANGTASVQNAADWVIGLEGSYKLKDGLAVRVKIKNPR